MFDLNVILLFSCAVHGRSKNKRRICGGRLFSCMGHSVNPNLAEEVLNGTHFLNAFTLLREPFSRIQSGELCVIDVFLPYIKYASRFLLFN